MRFRTEIEIKERWPGAVTHDDTIWTIGSCFADEIGDRMLAEGFDIEVNPLGTLYNPLSILRSIRNLVEGKRYEPADFFEHEGKYRSFDFHSAFARRSAEASAAFANETLTRLRAQLPRLSVLMLTYGSSRAFLLNNSLNNSMERGRPRPLGPTEEGHPGSLDPTEEVSLESMRGRGRPLSIEFSVVANCHKQNPKIFTEADLSVETCTAAITETLRLLQAAAPRLRTVILTVSPIRHKAYGLHADRLSKARLLLSLDQTLSHPLPLGDAIPLGDALPSDQSLPGSQSLPLFAALCPERQLRESVRAVYFPSYEIMTDDLRDYRFYAADMVHPSPVAVDYIYERFGETFFTPATIAEAAARLRTFRRSLHREN